MGTFTKLSYHIIFGTRYRRKTIQKQHKDSLYEFIGGIIRKLNGHLLEIGGVEDHVHILTNLSPAKAVSDSVRDIKSNSARWMNRRPNRGSRFEWQKGYSAFTVSYSQVELVRTYLIHQEEHHREKNFEDEYVAFLKRHGIEFDPKYLFEQEHHG